MMRCVHCQRPCILPDNTLINMESYMKPVVSITLCCGKLVTAFPQMTYRVMEAEAGRTEDDWARKAKV